MNLKKKHFSESTRQAYSKQSVSNLLVYAGKCIILTIVYFAESVAVRWWWGMDMRECYVDLYLFFDKICIYKIKAVILHAIMSEAYFAIINKQTIYHYGKLQRFRSGEHS